MLKKIALIGILGVTVILALSAFNSVGSQPEINNSLSVAQVGFHTPPPSACFSANDAGSNFRIAHVWNGIYIPSMDETSFLKLPTSACFPTNDANSNFRIAHVWNGIYIPSMDVTG